MERQPNTQYVLSISYGKDSLACLEAIHLLGYPLDRVIHIEVWATDDIEAVMPPVVEFKKKADKIIKDRYGIDVEHICARDKEGNKLTYEKLFYKRYTPKKATTPPQESKIYGFPFSSTGGMGWCHQLKIGIAKSYLRIPDTSKQRSVVQDAETKGKFSKSTEVSGAKINTIQYFGIAADEPKRIERHRKNGIIMPLVDIGWEEAYCKQWCREHNLLSPTYETAERDGCWFCPNQTLDSLRHLRNTYPELWQMMLKWDKDSPTSFHADGRGIADYERRFEAEDLGFVPISRKFRWSMIDDAEIRLW